MSVLFRRGVVHTCRLSAVHNTKPRLLVKTEQILQKSSLCCRGIRVFPRSKRSEKYFVNGNFLKTPVVRLAMHISVGSMLTLSAWKAFTYLRMTNTAFAAVETQKTQSSDEGGANGGDGDPPKMVTRRELRFNQFASCEYNGQVLMTPQDFLESLTENQPKFTRTGKVKLRDRDIDEIAASTPSISHGSEHFFRSLHQNGVITFSEYLFMVTVLTKSQYGLKIAFKMIDVDGNKHVSKAEFQAVEEMINRSGTQAVRSRKAKGEKLDATTLLVHLFGKDGRQSITFKQFFKFMENLQNEVLELEFHEFSRSMKTISELDFARILLRNTVLTTDEYRGYLDRLRERIPEPKGVTLDQFKAFNRFLNNIDDFSIAVRMFNVAHEPISKEAFRRAVKVSTGEDIDSDIVSVVFNLFDIDGDGKLSHVEFIGIMKDRLKRGFGKFPSPRGWAGFKHCMRKEVHAS